MRTDWLYAAVFVVLVLGAIKAGYMGMEWIMNLFMGVFA